MRFFAGPMPRIRFSHALIAYLILAYMLMSYVKWFVNNADSFQYLTIAERYADGSFDHVINGYWSPLIIWLLIVPLKVFSNGILAFKIVQIAIGAVTLYAWHRLLLLADLEKASGLLLLAVVPLLLARSLLTLTPDLLFVTVALALLHLVIENGHLFIRHKAILFGILGGALYLSKAFGFPFFLALLFVVTALELHRNSANRKKVLTHAAISAGFFLLVAGPWILALSLKYGHFTISEAARYNQTVEVAPMPGEFVFLPVITDGLHHPTPAAMSPWEAPGDLVELTPLRPWTDPQRYARLIERNLMSIYYYDVRRQFGTFFLITLGLALVYRGPGKVLRDRLIGVPLLMMVILTLGYALILVNTRYIWLNTFLMLLITARSLLLLLPARPLLRHALLAAALLLMIKRPVKEILYIEDTDVAATVLIRDITNPAEALHRTYHPDHVLMEAVQALRPLQLRGELASLQTDDPVRTGYASSLHIAYELGLRYHGLALMEDPLEVQLEKLHASGIRYFLVWDGAQWEQGRPLLRMDPPGPRLYDLQSP